MESLSCPRCKDENGYKDYLDKILFFFCETCGFQCPMRIYSDEIEDHKGK